MSIARKLDRPATYADLEALPPNVKGEIIDGVLYTMTRPRARHQYATMTLSAELLNPFGRARGGPGGWWILIEPGIELPGSPEVSPDLAGWRRERMPALPDDESIRVVPDWICEVLSPSNASNDTIEKMSLYHRVHVQHYWLLDPRDETLAVYRRHADGYLHVLGARKGDRVRAEPFEAIELSIAALFGDDEESA